MKFGPQIRQMHKDEPSKCRYQRFIRSYPTQVTVNYQWIELFWRRQVEEKKKSLVKKSKLFGIDDTDSRGTQVKNRTWLLHKFQDTKIY